MKPTKQMVVAFMLIILLILTGCGTKTGTAALGALGGAAISAGAYEIHMKNQRDRVEQDFKDGKIDKTEYDIRMNQIERDSFFK
jgi:major membrane immunogen (membrane-anchored lipoprotein)